jgi:hypothetical protein
VRTRDGAQTSSFSETIQNTFQSNLVREPSISFVICAASRSRKYLVKSCCLLDRSEATCLPAVARATGHAAAADVRHERRGVLRAAVHRQRVAARGDGAREGVERVAVTGRGAAAAFACGDAADRVRAGERGERGEEEGERELHRVEEMWFAGERERASAGEQPGSRRAFYPVPQWQPHDLPRACRRYRKRHGCRSVPERP